MCLGSGYVYSKVEAVAGQEYHVSNGGDPPYCVAVLHKPGDGHRKKDARIQCAACITIPTMVVITNAPVTLQEKHGTGPTVVGRFLPGDHATGLGDIIRWREKDIPFNDFIGETTRLELVAGEQIVATPIPFEEKAEPVRALRAA